MAHLVRPWLVRYVDADGKRCKSTTPGARAVRERAKKLYAAGVPGWPAGKRVPLAGSKAAAEKMLRELVERAERGQAGLTDVAHGRRPLEDHLDDFRRAMEDKGDTP